MDEKDIKQLEDYLSSLKGVAIIQYSFKGDINEPKYLLLSEVENGKITGQKLGPYGLDTTFLRDIAKKGFRIANFKTIDEVLKKKSKK